MERNAEYDVGNTDKTFDCLECGGSVGVIERDKDGHAVLVKYWYGMDGERRILVRLYGYGEACCDKCGVLRTWHASQQWLNDYVRRRIDTG